ncbi:MAG: GNAT family N-acetyltransferase [Lachnospiraceae bacterium]|nr:GNAT family N-acetyltransferase [Lachnospiraceae bacterium]
MIFETERLILRHWEEADAEDLFRYASDPDVGPIAGWPAHKSLEESREIIRTVFSRPEAYAICLKEDKKAIGAIELKEHTKMAKTDQECELGYWLGKPFWGRGIVPEATMEIIRHAFEDRGMEKVWCGYYEGNEKSKRVQEKCGFQYQGKMDDVDVVLLHEKRNEYVNLITKDIWNKKEKN